MLSLYTDNGTSFTLSISSSVNTDDITSTSPFPRLFDCHGNDLGVESPVKWVVWRRGGVLIPDWNRMYLPLEFVQKQHITPNILI